MWKFRFLSVNNMLLLKTEENFWIKIVVLWLSLLQNVIQQNLSSSSAQVQILPVAYRRFAMARTSDN